jgi:hypothetical protein
VNNPKPKVGRPRRKPEELSEGTPALRARVGYEMFETVSRMAAEKGESLADWVRQAIAQRVERDSVSTNEARIVCGPEFTPEMVKRYSHEALRLVETKRERQLLMDARDLPSP